jgi:hypothetical protein
MSKIKKIDIDTKYLEFDAEKGPLHDLGMMQITLTAVADFEFFNKLVKFTQEQISDAAKEECAAEGCEC